MSRLENQIKANFYISGDTRPFALRRMRYVPRKDEICIFCDVRFMVSQIEWCMDEDATEVGQMVNIIISRTPQQ